MTKGQGSRPKIMGYKKFGMKVKALGNKPRVSLEQSFTFYQLPSEPGSSFKLCLRAKWQSGTQVCYLME